MARNVIPVHNIHYMTKFVISQIWGEDLKDLVVERSKTGGRLVLRPDSGDPVAVVMKVHTMCVKYTYLIDSYEINRIRRKEYYSGIPSALISLVTNSARV